MQLRLSHTQGKLMGRGCYTIEIELRDNNGRLIEAFSHSIIDPWEQLPTVMEALGRQIDSAVMCDGGWNE